MFILYLPMVKDCLCMLKKGVCILHDEDKCLLSTVEDKCPFVEGKCLSSLCSRLNDCHLYVKGVIIRCLF